MSIVECKQHSMQRPFCTPLFIQTMLVPPRYAFEYDSSTRRELEVRLLRGSLARSRLLLQLRAMSDDAYVDALNAALRSGYGPQTTPRRDCHCCRHRTLCSRPTHKYSILPRCAR